MYKSVILVHISYCIQAIMSICIFLYYVKKKKKYYTLYIYTYLIYTLYDKLYLRLIQKYITTYTNHLRKISLLSFKNIIYTNQCLSVHDLWIPHPPNRS